MGGGAEEIILSDGVLFALVNPAAEKPEYAGMERIKTAYRDPFWDEAPRQVVAVEGETGAVLWSSERTVLPETLAADHRGVYFHDGACVVRLDRGTGEERWRSDPIPRSDFIRSFYAPTLAE